MRAHFAAATDRVAALAAAEPAVAHWQLRLAEARVHQSLALALVGRLDEAAAARSAGRSLLETLVAQDPKNRQWLVALVRVSLHEVAARLARRDLAAVPVLAAARARAADLVAAEPASLEFNRQLAVAWRLEVVARRLLGRADAADAAARAREIGERLVRENRADRLVRSELAQACLAAGRLAQADTASAAAAPGLFAQALAAVEPRLAGTADWRVLDPAAQALVLLGRPAEAQPLLDRLRALGYRSLDPFAGSILELASTQDSPPP
jgi:hypothetical protein